LAVLGQEGVHRTRLQKVLAEDGGVEELAIRLGGSLHPPILLDLSRNRESCRIAQRSPSTGLTIQADYDPNWYPTGVKVTNKELASVPLQPHDFHGEWNYTINAQSIPA
jgi:hypothetical protein